MNTVQLKTNDEMHKATLEYFEKKARASGEFEHKAHKPLPDLFYGKEREQSAQKIKQFFDIENRSFDDLVKLQDYEFNKTLEMEWNNNEQQSGFSRNKLLNSFHDIFGSIIDDVMQQKNPVAYKKYSKQYE